MTHPPPVSPRHPHRPIGLSGLIVGALGVVFGDIPCIPFAKRFPRITGLSLITIR